MFYLTSRLGLHLDSLHSGRPISTTPSILAIDMSSNGPGVEFVPVSSTDSTQTQSTHTHTTHRGKVLHCMWCGTQMEANLSGRKRKYCSQSCRQRAYEQRNLLAAADLDPDSVVLTQRTITGLQDRLYELRCSAEDIATAAQEGASAEELKDLTDELLDIARRVERFRDSE